MPPQHGAWAFLVVPFVVGTLAGGGGVGDGRGGGDWRLAALGIAWLGGYLLSYFALLAVKTRRPARVRPQLTFYASMTIPAAAVVLVQRPALLWFAPAFAALLAVNAWHAWRRADRALANDLASVLQCALMVLVAAETVGVQPVDVLTSFGVVLAYFVGSVLFVKTMIRERGDDRYLRGSIGYHAVAAAAVAVVDWPLGLLFGWFLVRAARLPHHRMTPKRVGLLELAGCVVLVVVIALTQR